MIQEPFAFGHSWIHQISPRYRIAAATLFAVVIALAKDLNALTIGLVLSALLIASARLPLMPVLRRLAVITGFLALIWLVLPITYEGPPLYTAGPLVFTEPGVMLCLQISFKSIAITASMISLVATMTVATLGQSLGSLKIPPKIVYLLLITYRYIFVLEQEYQRISRAMKIRGFIPRTNLHTYKAYAYLVGMLFVRANARSERVYQAMKCRGFKGRFYSLYNFPHHPRDPLFLAFIVTVLSVIVLIEILRFY